MLNIAGLRCSGWHCLTVQMLFSIPLIDLCNLFPAGCEEVILPDFGEGFGNSDSMLLGASPLS
jgi:hypothetical protein